MVQWDPDEWFVAEMDRLCEGNLFDEAKWKATCYEE